MSNAPVYRTIREQIADRIRLDVLARRLPEGTAIREQTLAEQFGVSRAPIRDALLQLTHEGLLVAKPNCGVRVSPALSEPLQPLVVDIRRRIEGFAVATVIEQCSDDELAHVDAALERMRVACEQGDASQVVEHDMGFHRCIIELAGARDVLSMWLPVVVRMMLHYRRHSGWMDSYAEHEAIVNAIHQRDKEAAIRAIEANIQ